jgi:Holliday junction resolvasome RuvABC endonuclease subunit
MILLGFDISSSVIGYSVIEYKNNKIKLLHYDYYEPLNTQKHSLYESLVEVKKFVRQKVEEFKPDKIIIEDIAQHFSGKGSTANTIIKLAVYNRTICLTVFEEYGIVPELINVNTVRSVLRPEDHEGRLMKEDVPFAIEKILKIKFNFIYKKKGKIDTKTYDMADAVAVSLAFIMKNIQNVTKGKKK